MDRAAHMRAVDLADSVARLRAWADDRQYGNERAADVRRVLDALTELQRAPATERAA